MKESPKTVTIDGVTFELRPNVKNPTNPDWVCLRKTPIFVDRYRALEKEFKGCNMVEVGVDQGGGTSFFLKHFKPRRLLAIELSKEPVTTLTDFLAEHDRDQRVTVHWGVDQADTVAVPRILDETFADQPLDIVVDDASHLLQETTTTFEMLFPRLRQKGVYIIEDWSSTHLLEGRLELDAASNPDGGSTAVRAATPELNYQLPMSYLICQLLIASARNPEWISSINAGRGICAIRRGIADIEPGTPISSYVGDIGRWMLDKSVV